MVTSKRRHCTPEMDIKQRVASAIRKHWRHAQSSRNWSGL